MKPVKEFFSLVYCRYEGTFADNVRNGYGTCYFVDGGEYVGHWRNDRQNGFGVHTYPNLDEYRGKWVGGMRCGKGVWRAAHGRDVYDGLWEADHPHGYGTRRYADGTMWVIALL